mmetsp:Transcript_51374/g.115359  ORF Transcript_51374/g.115359 Transcript_51374/m.115359 type:complete len:114 (-) Transcript_51374:290-631(-)
MLRVCGSWAGIRAGRISMETVAVLWASFDPRVRRRDYIISQNSQIGMRVTKCVWPPYMAERVSVTTDVWLAVGVAHWCQPPPGCVWTLEDACTPWSILCLCDLGVTCVLLSGE